MRGSKKIGLVASIGLAFFAMACEEHAPIRESANAQNNAFTKSKFQELEPAEGVYVGEMKLIRSNETFSCVLRVKRVLEAVRGSQPDQPAETVEVPKITATLTFPVLDNLAPDDFPKFSNLIDPMGRFLNIVVDYGHYNIATHALTLPYIVPSYSQTNNFGELSGSLEGKQYRGKWFAKPLGIVGHFVLVRRSKE